MNTPPFLPPSRLFRLTPPNRCRHHKRRDAPIYTYIAFDRSPHPPPHLAIILLRPYRQNPIDRVPAFASLFGERLGLDERMYGLPSNVFVRQTVFEVHDPHWISTVLTQLGVSRIYPTMFPSICYVLTMWITAPLPYLCPCFESLSTALSPTPSLPS